MQTCVMVALLASCNSSELLADNDLVFLKKSAIISRSRYVGTIADYNALKLTLVNLSGKKLEIDTVRISHIQTEFTASQQKAVQLFGEKKFELAYAEFAKALKNEKRAWVQREIVAKQVLCLSADSKTIAAIELFMSHFTAYPNTRFLHFAPINWEAKEVANDVQEKCETMLAGNPLEQLIGSSWLLSGSKKTTAINCLKIIASADPKNEIRKRIAQWSRMQLWRTSIAQAEPNEIDFWKAEIKKLSVDDRVGPILLLGQLLIRFEKHDSAAIEFMKLPILYPDRYQECAAALDFAAEALIQNGKSKEAQLVLQELANGYTTTIRARNRRNRAADNQKKINQ